MKLFQILKFFLNRIQDFLLQLIFVLCFDILEVKYDQCANYAMGNPHANRGTIRAKHRSTKPGRWYGLALSGAGNRTRGAVICGSGEDDMSNEFAPIVGVVIFGGIMFLGFIWFGDWARRRVANVIEWWK